MNVKTEQSGDISIVRVGETRMMYPMLAEFSGAVSALIAGGARRILIDLAPVTYVDSATIGCFMDLVEAAKHYPGLKKQWVEFLGERPTAETDRVETSDTAAA